MKIETDTFHISTFPSPNRPLPPPADGENEFAGFAAQFAHRAERLHQARVGEPPRHAVEAVTDADTRHTAEMWAGGLLLAGLAAAALFVWGRHNEPVTGSPAVAANRTTIEAPAPPVEAREAAAKTALPPINVPAPAREPLQAAPASAAASPMPATPGAIPPATTPGAAAPSPAAAPPTTTVATTTAQTTIAPIAAPASTPDPSPLSSNEVREMQSKLKAAGFDPGPIDGVVGPLTTGAARRYGEARTLASTDPARDMLVRLRSEPPQSAELPPR
jgi:hypothetical protein